MSLGGGRIRPCSDSKPYWPRWVFAGFTAEGWGTYRRHLKPRLHVVGKRSTQQLERKHLTLRTLIKRLVRRTLCFSKSLQLREIVIGLFISRYEFGLQM
jgi:insertion element IS1 protein InsB